jgi:hypothetical protein
MADGGGAALSLLAPKQPCSTDQRCSPRTATTAPSSTTPPNCHAQTQLTADWLDLERWYADPKRIERSYAVKTSKWLRARQAGVTG